MKLKAQIIEELYAANEKRREAYKATKTQDIAIYKDGELYISEAYNDSIYYEGMVAALNWVLESREDFTHCV